MSDELVERIARLIYDADALRPRLTWERLTPLTQGEYRKEARAALSALPSRELLREALGALEPFETMAHTYDCDDDEDGNPEVPDKRRLRIEETNGDLSVSIIDVGDFRRARAAADKIRAAMGGE